MAATGRYDYQEITELTDRPLFGESTHRDRVLNVIVGGLTGLFVLVTLVESLLVRWPPNGVNLFLSLIALGMLLSHATLMYWYRQGDLEPKFRKMIYYNAFALFMLCICANIYIYSDVALPRPTPTNVTATS